MYDAACATWSVTTTPNVTIVVVPSILFLLIVSLLLSTTGESYSFSPSLERRPWFTMKMLVGGVVLGTLSWEKILTLLSSTSVKKEGSVQR